MSLSDKLLLASTQKKIRLCVIGKLINSLPAKDKDSLEKILNVSNDAPNRVPNADIVRILREEGLSVSNSAMDRHRRAECSCYGVKN